MARNNQDVLVKRNSKLEAFLKRKLDEDTFERVRAHEPCIVCSEKEDKAFKFAVLSDEWIYLTENPPKTIVNAVHLGDIINIHLENDFPDFLSGAERENTQHICIEYLTNVPTKGWPKKKSPRSTASIKGGGLSARTTGSLNARSQTPTPPKPSSLKERGHGIKNDIRRSSLDAETLRDALNTGGARHKNKQSAKVYGELLSPDELPETPRSRTGSVTSSKSNKSTTPPSQTAKRRPRKSSSSDADEKDDPLDRRKQSSSGELSMSTKGELRLALEKLIDENDETETDDEFASHSTTPRRASSVSNSSLKGSKRRRRRKKSSLPSDDGISVDRKPDVEIVQEAGCCKTFFTLRSIPEDTLTGEEEDDNPYRTGVLHLYVLNLHSPTLMLMQSARHSYLVRSTMLQDEDYMTQTTGFVPKTSPGEKMAHLFTQLKTELLNPNNGMEDTFLLLDELSNAAERNFTLRKLFWKTPDLFQFMVQLLQKFMPKSRTNSKTEELKQKRADEFELAILTIETLALMMRETEILPARVHTLTSSKGRPIMDLVTVLTCFPEMPHKYTPPSSQAAALLNTSKSDQWESLVDAELSKLMQDFTKVSTALLADLILIAQQSVYYTTAASFFNTGWLMRILEELNTTEKFVERVVGQSMRFICPAGTQELSPKEAVLVYHQFFVLNTLVEFSPRIANFIRNNFYEEFKYYIRSQIVHDKLPDHYPISRYAIHLMQQVLSAILQRKVNLDTDVLEPTMTL